MSRCQLAAWTTRVRRYWVLRAYCTGVSDRRDAFASFSSVYNAQYASFRVESERRGRYCTLRSMSSYPINHTRACTYIPRPNIASEHYALTNATPFIALHARPSRYSWPQYRFGSINHFAQTHFTPRVAASMPVQDRWLMRDEMVQRRVRRGCCPCRT